MENKMKDKIRKVAKRVSNKLLKKESYSKGEVKEILILVLNGVFEEVIDQLTKE